MEALIVLLVLALLAGPVLAVIALVKTSTLQNTVRTLQKDMTQRTNARVANAPTDAPVEQMRNTSTKSNVEPEVAPEIAVALETSPAPEVLAPVDIAPLETSTLRNVEQALASRWLVWLGGVAIALGGLLLVKYASDNDLVPPIVRVVIGWASAAGLVAAGEWLRRNRGSAVQDYVPAALSAAGLIIAFGVSYAAYALYDIFAPAVVFPVLAAISLCAMWLATRQGPLIAALGLVGATFTPALVQTDNPSTSGFFAYLLVILVASLWLLRRLNWWWLGYAAVACTTGWALVWINGFGLTPSLPIGMFGLALGAAAVLVPRGREILNSEMGSLLNQKSLTPPMGIAIIGCAAGGIILSALAVRSSHASLPLLMFAVGMAALVTFGWLRNGLVAAPLLSAAVTLLVLMAWQDVGFHDWAFDEHGFWTTVPGLIEPPRFRNAMLVALVGFTGAGVLGSLWKDDKRTWSALSAASAIGFLFGAWGRADFTLSWQVWAGLAIGLAGLLGFVANKLRATYEDLNTARSIEFVAAGIVLLLVFALDRSLDGVWLTLAIAALAAAVAFTTRVFLLPNIGGIASAVASFAAIRLFLSREFWGEPQDLPLGAYWVLYGYGVPAALFWQASKWLTPITFTRWRVAFEGISLGLIVSMASLMLRVWIGGGITHDGLGLLELAAHACAWLGAAYGLAYRQQLYSTFISVWGARILLAASCVALLAALTVKNPVLTGDPVVGGQVFNTLWLAYLAPVVILTFMARKLEALGWADFRNALGVFTLVLLMTFITLLVKRQFQGPSIDIEFLSEAESYAVSLAWLVSGIGIFATGLKLDRQNIRYGGLAILVLTVLKVFGFDLFSLGGLWRIASIIGLGLCLVGVGWLYTRFMVQRSKAAEV
jgi:uncharacterized membrane protein